MTTFIPYGRLADGKMGVLVENGTSVPLVSASEILDTLPTLINADNFEGRIVYAKDQGKPFIFSTTPVVRWLALEGAFPTIGAVNGNPPASPTPTLGALFFDTDSGALFIWDSARWVQTGSVSQVITQRYLGDGVTTVYPIGAPNPLGSDYVEVFLDGIRQFPNPAGAYDLIGTAVIFTNPPPSAVKVMIRSLIARAISQNSQIKQSIYTATSGQTVFPLPSAGLDPASVFVYENGVFRGLDTIHPDGYTITTQNTKITNLVKVTSTLAELTCEAAHSLNIGATVTLRSTNKPSYNGSFVVASIESPLVFRITVPSSNPSSAQGDPLMYWGPPVIPDNVVFNTGRTLSNKIHIRTITNVVLGGESNVGENLGSGAIVYAGKNGSNLQFKSLVKSGPIIISELTDEVSIGAWIPDSDEANPGFPAEGSLNSGFYGNGAGLIGIGSKGNKIVEMEDSSGVSASVQFKKTDAIRLPMGNTAERPGSPIVGDFRGHSVSNNPEFYTGTYWSQIMAPRGFASVVFDGTQSVGVITTLAGKNIGSVTKLSTGLYTIVFSASTFNGANYLILGNARVDTSSGTGVVATVAPDNQSISASTVTIQVVVGGLTYDADRVSLLFAEF